MDQTTSTTSYLFVRAARLLVFLCVLASGCWSSPPNPNPPAPPTPTSSLAFAEATDDSLSRVRYRNGRGAKMNTILEIVGGGVGIVDFDQDGNDDLFFPGGGEIKSEQREVVGLPSTLLRGDGSMTFVDVTEVASAGCSDLYTHGIAAADYDNDGFPDLLVSGYAGVRLLHNLGDGTFEDVTRASGLHAAQWTTSAAWLDLDNDGSLDLYLASYVKWNFETHTTCPTRDGVDDVCSPTAFDPSPDGVFESNADGTFSNISDRFAGSGPSKGLGVLATDLNGDRRIDIYVTNDLMPNTAWMQRDDHTFDETGFQMGLAVGGDGKVNGSMGVVATDYNSDQRLDLLVTNFEHEDIALYESDDVGLFQHRSGKVGLRESGVSGVGFGIAAADFDNDGDDDVMIANGHVQYFPDSGPTQQLPLLLENHQQRYRRHSSACDYAARKHIGRGIATSDLDQDGDVDMVISHLDAAPALLENRFAGLGSWLKIKLVGSSSNRSAIGTTVIADVGSQKIMRQVIGGGSYLSQSSEWLHFAWSNRRPASIQIQWPSGITSELKDIAPGQSLTIVEAGE